MATNLKGTMLLLILLLQIQNSPALASEVIPAGETTAQKQQSTKPDAATWNAWHKALAEELFARMKKVRRDSGNETLQFSCKIFWRVSSAGDVILNGVEGTKSLLAQKIVKDAIASMKGCALLKFPEGSARDHIDKVSTYHFASRKLRIGDFDSTLYQPPHKRKQPK
jgi:hypothetical protein